MRRLAHFCAGRSTLTPITQASSDAYPNGGQVRVTGAAGSQLLVTAVSNTQVRRELDADGDGAHDAMVLKQWGTSES
jgi:hypothetical protein